MNLKCCMTSFVYNRSVYLGKGQVKCSTDNDDYIYPWKALWIWGRYSQHSCYANGELSYCILVWEQQCWQNLFTCQIFIGCIIEWCRRVSSAPIFIFRKSWFWNWAQKWVSQWQCSSFYSILGQMLRLCHFRPLHLPCPFQFITHSPLSFDAT